MLMIILLASTFTFGQCKLDYSNYHLVFEDYFQTRGAGAYTGVTSGANPLSTNYTFTGDPDPLGGWGDYTDGFGTVHYGEYYDPSQVSFIPGGGIQLEADRITTPITLSNGRVPTYKSGILRTISTYEYGMFEITAALYVAPCPMDKPGCEYSGWPTFWLATDPDLSEIDVFDGPNPNSARQMKTNVINNISHASCGRFSQKLDADLTKYNTYTCVWTPTKVSFFFNGREMFTTDNSVVSLTPVFNHIYLTLQMCDYFYPDVSYYDIKSLKVYQANINAKTGIPDYDASYQSSKEFMNYDIFGDPGAPLVEAVSSNYKSIAVTNDPNTVFYRGVDWKPYEAVNTGSTWNVISMWDPTSPYPAALVNGDIVWDNLTGKLFYRGMDDRLCYYIYDTWGMVTGWHQGYIDDIWTTTDNTVSETPGSIAVANNGDVYYIGWDNIIHKWENSTNTFSRINVLYPPVGSNPKSDIRVDYVGADIRISYKGMDEQLHVLGFMSGSTTDFWHAYITPSYSLVSHFPGAFINSNDGTFYIGEDNKIHRYYWTPTSGFIEDLWFLAYPYTGPDVPIGNLSYDVSAPRLIYFGQDGRLQYFQKDYTTSTYFHAWIDDYWNTNEYVTKTAGWIPYWSPSLVASSIGNQYFYNGDCDFPFYATGATIDKHQHLRYFNYESCEILNPPCVTDWNVWHANWHNLGRIANHLDSSASSSQLPVGIQISPNPAQNNITIIYPCKTSGLLEISIKDVAGRLRYTGNVNCNKGTYAERSIDISSYTSGVYLVDLTLNDQHVVKKIIKL